MKQLESWWQLLVAPALVLLVLLVMLDATTMVARQHSPAAHKGAITDTSPEIFNTMNKDIRAATFLFAPTTSSRTGDIVGGCTNWAPMVGGQGKKIDESQPVSYFLYCVDGDGARFANLYRYRGTVADCRRGVTLPDGCGSADSAGAAASLWVAGNGLNYGISRDDDPSGYYFARSGFSDIEIHYIIGNPRPAAKKAGEKEESIPTYYRINTTVETAAQ